MKVRRLEKREFARAIERGLGRALLHVKEYGDDGIEDDLLNACLHNLAYDRQFEDGRSWWLMQILPHTRRMEFYADRIKEALVSEDEPTDFNQLACLAIKLFEQGFSEFKDVLSSLGPRNIDDEGLRVQAEMLVHMNGFAGLRAGAILMQENSAETWEKVSFYETALQELEEVGGVVEFLKKEAASNSLIASFSTEVHAELQERDTVMPQREPPTLSEVIAAAENEPATRRTMHPYRSFGKRATDEEILTIAERLEREDNPDKQYGYLSVFGVRALPVVTPKVLSLFTAQNKNVRRAARNALALVKSPVVRNLALESIRRDDDESIAYGLRILHLNFQPEDAELILQALQKVEDQDFLHWSGSAVRDIADHANDPSVLAECLTWVCEFDPCGPCRGSALKKLIACGRTPKDLLYEAQWDANRSNRLMARSAIGVSS